MDKKIIKFYEKIYRDICKFVYKKDLHIDSIYIDSLETIIVEHILDEGRLLKVCHHFNNLSINKEFDNGRKRKKKVIKRIIKKDQ